MWGLYVHFNNSAVNTYVQCGSHIFSVINVKCVYNAPYCIVECSEFIFDTWVYIFHISHQIFGIYGISAQFSGHSCFHHISGNNMWSIYCSWLYFGPCAKIFVQYAYLVWWLCDLHLQCSSYSCSVIYAKCVYSVTGSGHLMVILREETGHTYVELCHNRALWVSKVLLRKWS